MIAALFRETRELEKRKIYSGDFRHSGFSTLAPDEKFAHIAMAAFNADVNPHLQKGAIVSTIANSSLDRDATHQNLDQILSQIESEQQTGGPLDELIKERMSGQITPLEYRKKIVQYVNELAHQNNIPLRPPGQ